MNKKLLSLLTFASISLSLTNSASAVEPNKLYFKAFGGYSIGSKPKTSANGSEGVVQDNMKNFSGAVGGAGLGYNLSDAFRTDLTVDFNKLSSSLKDDKEALKMKKDSITALLNLYFDFNNDSAFTPYVTGGIGMQNLKATISPKLAEGVKLYSLDKDGKPNIAGGELKEITSKRQNKFTFQVGAGVAYKAAENMYIDLSYRLSRSDSVKLDNYANVIPVAGASPETKIFKDNSIKAALQHAILLGIRFNF